MNDMASAVISLAEKYLGDIRIRNGQVIARKCPFCKGGDNDDIDTFAVGLHNGAFSCLRGSCHRTGSFRELCEYFGVRPNVAISTPLQLGGSKKVYDTPDPEKLLPLTEQAKSYLMTRRISEETMEAFRLACDKDGNIVFPFYREDKLIYVKFRQPRKHRKEDKSPKEWQLANTMPILFGMDMVSANHPLYITEGEIDALSLYEAGITNVVSVPCGCNNMDWIQNCWDWLEKFQEIIIFGDGDDPGVEMMNTVMRRLGEDRCMIPQPYPELVWNGQDFNRLCKDANEILCAYGAQTLREIAEKCEPAPVKGVVDLAHVPFVDPSSIPRIYTKIPMLDNAIGGFAEGGLTIFSGKRGEGKSTITGQFLLNAINEGHSVCAYSGELPAYKVLEWIMSQACDRKYMSVATDARSGKRYACVPYEVQQRIRDWLETKFYLFDDSVIEPGQLLESMISVFSVCARRYGCKLFLVDNMMMLTSGMEEEYRMQATVTDQLKKFARKYKVHVMLVCHPRKTKEGESFNNETVAGSAAITNLADNVISIEKPNIRVTKNREFGETCLIECDYDRATRRIFQSSTGDRIVYGWDHTGLQLPEESVENMPEFGIQHGRQQPAPI